MIDVKEFTKLLEDGYFPRKLKAAVKAFPGDLPMQHWESAYRTKFMLKAKKDDRFTATENPEVKLNQDENTLFNRTSFIQVKEESSGNDKIMFNILDIDGDGKLSFPEFYALMRNWRIFVELSGGIYSKHPS
jgi:hypothetical protein